MLEAKRPQGHAPHVQVAPLLEQVSILQAQFLFCFLYLPEDALFVYCLISEIPEEASGTLSFSYIASENSAACY